MTAYVDSPQLPDLVTWYYRIPNRNMRYLQIRSPLTLYSSQYNQVQVLLSNFQISECSLCLSERQGMNSSLCLYFLFLFVFYVFLYFCTSSTKLTGVYYRHVSLVLILLSRLIPTWGPSLYLWKPGHPPKHIHSITRFSWIWIYSPGNSKDNKINKHCWYDPFLCSLIKEFPPHCNILMY